MGVRGIPTDAYLALAPRVHLKRLEELYLYNARTDELYELNDEAWEFMLTLDGTRTLSELAASFDIDDEFLTFLVDERLLEFSSSPRPRDVSPHEYPAGALAHAPSLRYLHVLVTRRCNLSCRHCFLGSARPQDMDPALLRDIAAEFSHLGGLRLLVSGGEPTEHPAFEDINSALADRAFRAVLLTNGRSIARGAIEASKLSFDEVQLSLDGLEQAHDWLRGKGSFRDVLTAAKAVADAGLDLSIATVITSKNVAEFDELARLVRELGAVRWHIDFPCGVGRASTGDIVPDLSRANLLSYAFGSETHGSPVGHICGAHLASILPDGTLVKCDYYEDWAGGNVADGLLRAWLSLPRLTVTDLECDCEFVLECRGGCRYRAEVYNSHYRRRTAPDPVRCYLYGVGTKPLEPTSEGRDDE